MRKTLFTLLLALGTLPAAWAQSFSNPAFFPSQGSWNTQFQAPLEVTGPSYALTIAAPVVLVNSAGGVALSLPRCWGGQRYDIVYGPAASTLGTAIFTASGSGEALTVSTITYGSIALGTVVSGLGVPSGTEIVSQTSGSPGGVGTYTTSAVTTASASNLSSGGVTVTPLTPDTWSNGTSGAGLVGAPHTALTAVGTSGGGCFWIAN